MKNLKIQTMMMMLTILFGLSGKMTAQQRVGRVQTNESNEATTVVLNQNVIQAMNLGKYALPFKGEDLKPGERYKTGNHKGGIQEHGKDVVVWRYVGNDSWSSVKNGTNGSKNEDALAYGKPFYAIEDGEVCACWRNAPENPKPGEKHEAMENGTMVGGGNHLWIKHADGTYALYAHAIPNTIPSKLCPFNDDLFDQPKSGDRGPDGFPIETTIPEGNRPKVKKGDFLGKIGNSGSSSGTHLHFHVQKDGNGKIMNFSNGLTKEIVNKKAGLNGWKKLNGNAIPEGQQLIWPPITVGKEYARHGFPLSDFQRMFDHLTDSGYELNWLDGYSVGNKPYLNFVFVPNSGKAWRSYAGLNASQYQAKFNDAKEDGLQPTFVDTYTIGDQVKYNVIFKKVGGNYMARHGLTVQQHEQVMDEAKSKGLKPVCIAVAPVGNNRYYTVLYRSENIGSWIIKSQVEESDYQTLYNDQKSKGRSPLYLNAYKFGSKVYISTVFASNVSGALKARHGMSPSNYQNEWQNATSSGYETKVVTAFDNAASTHRFAALWRK